MAYAFKRSITIDHTQVPSTQSGFPVLVYISDASFKTAAHSGHIQNTVTQSGGNPVTMPADMVFTSDAGGTTKIPWEVDSYDGTNGILWAWVYLSSVSSSVDTVFYVFYDDVTVTTQQNTSSLAPSNVWNGTYVGVWHLSDGTTLYTNDSSPTGANVTANGSGVAATGKIDGGYGTFANGYLQGANQSALNFTTQNFSASFWMNQGTAANWLPIEQGSFNNAGWYVYCNAGVDIALETQHGTQTELKATGIITNNTWLLIHVVRTGSTTGAIYLNGVAQSVTGSVANPNTDNFDPLYINSTFGAIKGTMDEARVASVALTADWCATEYHNQNNPGAFSVVGAETANATNLSISVSETTTVTDTVSMKEVSYINVQDTTVVSETKNLEEISSISVNDTTVISESVNLELISYINVTDTSVVTDSPTILIPILTLSVSDTTAMAESVTIEDIEEGISVSDLTIVSDTATLFIPVLTLSVSDTITVTDVVSLFITVLKIVVTDTTIVSDVETNSIISYINVNDTTPISEVVNIVSFNPLPPVIGAKIIVYLGWKQSTYIIQLGWKQSSYVITVE